MIRVIRVCRKCGAKIFSDAPRGLCTACVLETALGIFAGCTCSRADRADEAGEGEWASRRVSRDNANSRDSGV